MLYHVISCHISYTSTNLLLALKSIPTFYWNPGWQLNNDLALLAGWVAPAPATNLGSLVVHLTTWGKLNAMLRTDMEWQFYEIMCAHTHMHTHTQLYVYNYVYIYYVGPAASFFLIPWWSDIIIAVQWQIILHVLLKSCWAAQQSLTAV